jgi:hypothetical protein
LLDVVSRAIQGINAIKFDNLCGVSIITEDSVAWRSYKEKQAEICKTHFAQDWAIQGYLQQVVLCPVLPQPYIPA